MTDSRGELSGKVAIVTGGSRGIGAATAEALASAGAAVTVAARSEEVLEQVVGGITASGGTAQAVPTDTSDEAQVQRMVDRTVSEFGRVDLLLNVAGVGGPNEVVWKADPTEWARASEIELVGTFLPCRFAVPHMVQQGSGRVLNVTSATSFVPTPRISAYASAKAGVNQFTRVLALELTGTGVTAIAVDPGLVETPLVVEPQAWAGLFPWRIRAQHPSEPARLLRWLCGPVGSWMNGQVVAGYDPTVRWILQLPPLLRSA